MTDQQYFCATFRASGRGNGPRPLGAPRERQEPPVPEEFDEALEAARAEWASEHEDDTFDESPRVAASMAVTGFRCIDLSQLSSHDLLLVDQLLDRCRAKNPPSRQWLRTLPW